MPTSKVHWSLEERRETQLVLEQLRAEEIDVGEDFYRAVGSACPIEITQGADFGDACQLAPGKVVYCIPVRIVARGTATLEDLLIESPWDSESIERPDLREVNGQYKLGPIQCLTGEVLNDRLARPVPMKRGAILEGKIIARGMYPIPEQANHRKVRVRVTIFDTLDRSAHSEIAVEAKISSQYRPLRSPTTSVHERHPILKTPLFDDRQPEIPMPRDFKSVETPLPSGPVATGCTDSDPGARKRPASGLHS